MMYAIITCEAPREENVQDVGTVAVAGCGAGMQKLQCNKSVFNRYFPSVEEVKIKRE